MNYPLISEYIEAIKNAEDNFNELSHLRPVLNKDGSPIMSSGNFAVVFKMKDESSGKLYAVKCFLKEQEERDVAYQQITDELEYVSSNYLCSINYFQKELFVDSTVSSDTEFPVLLMDWAEGVTLDKYVHQHISDKYALQLITYQFCKMAAWLMSQPFAHGDLKPDNILVTEDGALVLVDYDGMYVPAMQGQKARELGSPDYRHPLRTEDCFNEHIDDFPLALIGMSLKAIALDTSLLQNNARSDSLLFSESDFHDIGKCLMMKSLCALLNDAEFSKLYALFTLAHSQQELSAVSFRLFLLNKVEKPIEEVLSTEATEEDFNKVEKPIEEVLSTEATEEDFKYAIEDEYGVKYSRDGKKLLKASSSLREKEYVVREGTEVICDRALRGTGIRSVKLPSTIISIGSVAFAHNELLVSCNIPASVKYIAHNNPWRGCFHIMNMDIQSKNFIIKDGILYSSDFRIVYGAIYWKSVFNIDNRSKKIYAYAFWSDFFNKNKLKSIGLSNIEYIGKEAFRGCDSLQSVTIPNSVTSIGDGAFSWCTSLQSITIPNSVTKIGDGAFSRCKSLQSITIPNSVTKIGDGAFSGCNICFFICNSTYFQNDDVYLFNKDKTAIVSIIKDCVNYIIPSSVTSIGDEAFSWCRSLQSVTIPNSVKSIGDHAFEQCGSLQSITIPNSVTSIGNSAFSGCDSLQSVTIPNSVTKIGDGAFSGCHSLQSVTIPNSVTSIGDEAFCACDSLQSVTIPNSVTSIGDKAFSWCNSLQSITIPNSVKSIGNGAFSGCDSLQSVTIPNSVTSIGDEAFRWCNSLQSVTIPNSVTSIGDKAFSLCKSLQSITIPNSVTKIGSEAFSRCESLQSITITNSVTSIGYEAFFLCTHLDEPSRLRLKELNYTQY
ncbi:MAG: leucine-rich repeat protein [Bacteroidales bacterium]|nr:leucine-rich repeat protein [Bacteroidales bacterium]MDY2710282.1 leucine-rich repeat protein [Sodaliphilus sp.]